MTAADRKSGSAGMPRPRSTLFPYTTLFRSYPRFPAPVEFIAAVIAYYVHPVNIQTACLIISNDGSRSEERFSRNAETEIYTLSLHDALPILPSLSCSC